MGDYRVSGALQNLAHVIGFTAVSYLLAAAIQKWRSSIQESKAVAFLLAALIAAFVALFSELSQIPSGRDASVEDLLLDLCGIAAGQLFRAANSNYKTRRLSLRAFGLLLLAAATFNSGYLFLAVMNARVNFPLLAGFETKLELRLTEPKSATVALAKAPDHWRHNGKAALVIPQGRSQYEGVSLFGFPSDWRVYKTLSLIIATESASEGRVSIRVNDAKHNYHFNDRFNLSLSVSRRATVVKIPMVDIRNGPSSRRIELNNIQELMIFVSAEDRFPFFVDDIRLE